MLRKIAGCFGVSLVGAALASPASAQDANVTTGSKSAKLGVEFRSELTYDDHGLQKTDGFTPDKTTKIAVQAVNVKLSGWVNNDTEYGFRFNLLTPAAGVVEYGYGTHWFSKMVGFSVGRMRVHQGGWDNMDSSYRTHATGVYGDNLVYRSSYGDMIALHVMAGGKVTLQILNDVTTPSGGDWNKSAHPTWVLGWMGEFGPIKPLFDIGSYDNNKSRWIDVGIKTEMAGLAATLDFYNLNHVNKETDPTDGKAKEAADVATSITLNVAYEVKNVVTPWVYYSTYENKQADDSKLELKDEKTNTTVPATATEPTSFVFDDNGVVYGVGVDVQTFGKGWTPYLALVSRSGKFLEAGKEETKSEMQVKLGVLGEI